MRLLIGTRNPGKFTEITEVLSVLLLTFVAPDDVGITTDPVEESETFHENALAKARHFFEASTLPTIADDSGIIVEALQEELGVRTRRWGAGPNASDDVWIAHFLERMRREENKRATFTCVIALVTPEGQWTFEGTCDGVITNSLEAPYLPGLPISACFRPQGFDRVFSALTVDEKNRVSHRGKAAQKLCDFLRSGKPRLSATAA